MHSLATGGEAALDDFVHSLIDVIGHADRAESLKELLRWADAAGGTQERHYAR